MTIQRYLAELQVARETIANISQQNPAHNRAYLQTQWERQRELQLNAINVRSKEKRARLEVLIKLEEDLLEARQVLTSDNSIFHHHHIYITNLHTWSSQQMRDMDAANDPIRTAEQRNALLDLPRTLVELEEKIQEVADEVGNTELLNARRRGNDRVKAVLTVQVALGFLYEAKFGAEQQQVDAGRRTRATQQPRNEQLRTKKRALLKKKLNTYLRHAARYNAQYRPVPRLLEPTFDEVVAMDMLHPFWDEAALNHPDEPWASCQITKDGIVALRSEVSSEEEMRRLGREVRQMMGWGIDYQRRLEATKPHEGNARVVEWNSIHSGLDKRTCRLWKQWDRGLIEAVHITKEYVEGIAETDVELIQQWEEMVGRTADTWEAILGVPVFWTEEEFDEQPAEEDHDEEMDWIREQFFYFV
ncbi:uncharacterized protein MELLADRAFT_86399 [Melampsora larici-populina 98AG31]|uniref:Uncharacterized protein n=1 Tax=Melampsora larici-populina (strain 98AG31 / pathotype 3-4-7) TaxID=747676 RepID=F4RLN3_MELLP|nr:uncharacterized protein MELLADRAFT_86399 [Melampsora larici-populina 98AG31]EGG06564.1 hypothetical protein MELLADRAFT_86399 [Melampsora larici-populina 98AG31]